MATRTVLIPLDSSAWSRQILPIIRQMTHSEDYTAVLLRVADVPIGMAAEPPMYVPIAHDIVSVPRSVVDAHRGVSDLAEPDRGDGGRGPGG